MQPCNYQATSVHLCGQQKLTATEGSCCSMYHNFSSALLVQSSFKQLAEIIEDKKWTQIEGGGPCSCVML